MKKYNVEERDLNEYNWNEDEWQGRSHEQVQSNTRSSGCTFVLFVIALVWWGLYELVMWLF